MGPLNQVLYAPSGNIFAYMSGGTLVKYIDPMVNGMAAVHNGDGTGYFQHADWLGSSREAISGGGAVVYDRSYAPFGEPYAETTNTNRDFTGQREDTVAGLYDFLFRQQSQSQGRWLVPDPAGFGAVDITNPQTWNRYAYVLNNPLSGIDPQGFECVWDNGSFDSADDPNTGSYEQCQSKGGNYFDPGSFKAGGGQDWSPNPNQNIANLLGDAGSYQLVANGTGSVSS